MFCKLAPFQDALYNHFHKSPEIQSLLRGSGNQSLKTIDTLKKLCNHPDLLSLPDDLQGSEQFFPKDYTPGGGRNLNAKHSGKMIVLDRLILSSSGFRLNFDNLLSDFSHTSRKTRRTRSFSSAITRLLWTCLRSFSKCDGQYLCPPSLTLPN